MDFRILFALIVMFVMSGAIPFHHASYEEDFEMDLLSKFGINDPTKSKFISKRDIVIPDHIQEQYDSMLRQHREKRGVITKGIRKIPGIPGRVLYANAKRQRFTFQLDQRVPADSEIIMAEMKIYQDRANEAVFFDPSNHTHRHHPSTARVSLHQIVQEDGADQAIFADERMIAVNSSGWKVFDITDTITRWTSDPTPTIDIELSVEPIRQGRHAKRIADKVRFITEEMPNDAPYGYPVLTVYTVKYMPDLEPEPIECHETPVSESGSQRCCRSSRYIDFRNMRWANRWVIEPAGFEAYDCAGTCHHRSQRDLFDTLLNPSSSLGGGGHRGSNYRTCGIARSTSLPMMYMVERDGVMELKVEEIPNMIAEECSCMR